MVYEDLSIDFGRRNKHPKSRYGVQTRLRALLEPAINIYKHILASARAVAIAVIIVRGGDSIVKYI